MSKEATESIREKISKLLKLAGNNPNEHERARAMEMAEKLMGEYNLDLNRDFKGKEDKSPIDMLYTDIPADDWRRFIGSACCQLYYCKLIINTAGRQSTCAFVGTEVNRQVALEFAQWLIAKILKESKDTFYLKSDQDDFCYGAGQAIQIKAEQIIRDQKFNAPKTGGRENQLMVLRDDLSKQNDDWYRKANPYSGYARPIASRNGQAVGAGVEYGQATNLSRQVGGKQAPKRIG